MEYGIQMYSVRDITEREMERALCELSGIGYKCVEFAGFFSYTAEQIKSMLDKYCLSVSGTHTGWGELTDENFEKTIAYHKAIGNKNIIIPGADTSTKEKLDDFIGFINRVAPKLSAEGIELHYHNHSHEFIPTSEGYTVHEELEKRTNIKFEIDTYWCFHAGCDPVATLERLKDRISIIHIKDGMASGEGKPLGMGEAPVSAVYEKALELGLLMVVESETLSPDGLTEARLCIEHLKKLEK